jgi:hypothetical protein
MVEQALRQLPTVSVCLFDHITSATGLVESLRPLVSFAFSVRGSHVLISQVMPLAGLVRACRRVASDRQSEICVVVDGALQWMKKSVVGKRTHAACCSGAHGVGHVPIDLESLQPDFYCSNFHKVARARVPALIRASVVVLRAARQCLSMVGQNIPMRSQCYLCRAQPARQALLLPAVVSHEHCAVDWRKRFWMQVPPLPRAAL